MLILYRSHVNIQPRYFIRRSLGILIRYETFIHIQSFVKLLAYFNVVSLQTASRLGVLHVSYKLKPINFVIKR